MKEINHLYSVMALQPDDTLLGFAFQIRTDFGVNLSDTLEGLVIVGKENDVFKFVKKLEAKRKNFDRRRRKAARLALDANGNIA